MHYLPFDPDPRPARLPPPPLACDAQFHVFGPAERYPVAPGAAYQMPSATWEAALAMHRALGLSRGVVVQATTYGAAHEVVLDALAALGPAYRGCANAAVLVEGTDADVERLHAAGVRGARLSRQGLGLSFTGAVFRRVVARARELGWYLKVQPEAAGFAAQASAFDEVETTLVIDHMGRPDVSAGLQDPSLQAVLRLLRRGHAWVMLSLGEKLSRQGPPWSDVVPFAQACIEAAPDRCVWGSDWPHPLSTTQPPNDGLLLDLLGRYAPDPLQRRRILVDNPARLFGFDP